MYKGCVLSSSSALHSSDASFINSCHSLSFIPKEDVSSFRLRTTICLIRSRLSTASSTISFRLIVFPLRNPTSAVIIILDLESSILSRSDMALNPEKTTVWIAPMRAHASMAIRISGTIGR